MEKQDVLSCQISAWYDTFKNFTFKSKFISLPKEVIGYLLEDGFILPEGCECGSRSADCADSEDEVDWDEEPNAKQGPSFPEINEQIIKAVKSLGGSVFPKLNWSCPKDAAWIAADKTLKCTCPGDIYLLLKSSDFITHDLTEPFDCCSDSQELPRIDYQLALRRWHSLNGAGEFRCFVKNKCLIGISQRHHRVFYQTVLDDKDNITSDIINFFTDTIQSNFPLQNYVVDVYVKEKGKVYLVDFNPYGPVTDSLLFDWEDLLLEKPYDLDVSENATIKPIFRCVESKGHVQTSSYECYAIPQDFVHLSSGLDPQKLMDFMQMKSQHTEDSSTDDDDEDTGGEGTNSQEKPG